MQPRGEIKADLEGYFTYQQAATKLDRSVESIQKAVSAGILHPVRFSPSNTRYLKQDEVEWFEDKPLSIPIAEAYRQLQEAWGEMAELKQKIAELKTRMQEDSSGTLGLLLVLAVVAVGLGLLAGVSNKSDDTKAGSEHDGAVHDAFINSLKELETRKDYPAMAKALGNALFDLARKEELTSSERRLISELWKVLTMPGDDLSKLTS